MPWLDLESLRHASQQELIDMAREHITLSLTSTQGSGERLADLTGGRDSRLVLASTMLAGVANQMKYETVGPPDLADVRVASTIAKTFGLDHRVHLQIGAQRPEFGAMVRRFVADTGGICNIWDARPLPDRRSGIRISGANGECLRAHQVLAQPVSSPSDLAQLVGRSIRYGHLRLLRPDIEIQFERSVQDLLLNDPFVDSPALDLLDTYQFLTRARQRYGPLDELQSQPRVLPLYSPTLVRIAFAIGGSARQRALIHFNLVRDASTKLVRLSFAGAGWSDILLASLPDGDMFRPDHTSSEAVGSEALFARLQRTIPDERKSVLYDVLSDQDNLAWHALDRGRAVEALRKYDDLTNTGRKELFGAVTAALWLGHHA